MIVKVCGLKESQNIQDIVSLDIDWIGYNFYKPSSRYITIVPTINNEIHQKKVGIFVNESMDIVKDYIDKYDLDLIQLHGNETPEYCINAQSHIPIIKVFRIYEDFDFDMLDDYRMAEYFLFDTETKNYGGSGIKFDWNILNYKPICRPFLLSGGIGPDDVDEILKIGHLQFKGIDINSKFEISQGIKDVEMVNKFVADIRKRTSFRYPDSLKGRPTSKDLKEAMISPFEVGPACMPWQAGVEKSNEETSRNPQSLKGRPTLKNVGHEKSNEEEFSYDMFYGANPNIFEKAASLRRKMTSEELKVWDFLKSKPLGLKFRRQHPIDLFIADFYCHSIKLVVEIDGINHQYSMEADLNRDNLFKNFGITILRYTNNEVNSNFQDVINKILGEANNLKKSPIHKPIT